MNLFINISFIVIGVFLINFFIKQLINLLFKGLQTGVVQHEMVLAKLNTVRSLLKNSTDIIIFGGGLLIILMRLGINIGPILTGAGILGLALSFGAQSLIKDLIAGIFIIIEDQCNIGDRVKIDNFEGKVTKITLRIIVLKDDQGNIIYIPNSQIKTLVKKKTKS
jgi:small conductance mechanosensitive channel